MSETNDEMLDPLRSAPSPPSKPERKYSQLLCLHNRIDYRIETSGRSGEIAAKMSIAPVCRDCGIAMHFEQPTLSYDETRLWVRLVPGVGGKDIPEE